MKNWIILTLPELTLSAAALLLFLADVVLKKRLKALVLVISVLSLVAALVMVLSNPAGGRSFGMLVHDDFSSFFKVLAIASAILILLLSERDSELLGVGAGS